MSKRKPRLVFPTLDTLIVAIDVVMKTLEADRYFFRPANGGPGQAFEEMASLSLVRLVIQDTFALRPHLRDFPYEVYLDITSAADEANCTLTWVKNQFEFLATRKHSGLYGGKEDFLVFLRELRSKLRETRKLQL